MNSMPARASREMKVDLQAVGISHKHIHAEDQEGYDMIGEHWDQCLGYLGSRGQGPGALRRGHQSVGADRLRGTHGAG